MHRSIYLSILIVLLSSNRAWSQDSTRHRKVRILPVPTIGYSPETRTYIGVVSLFTLDLYRDSATRLSNAKLEFNYTWNRQLILEAGWSHFFRHEAWFTQGTIHYSKFPDLYYGIGPQTPDSNKRIFNSNRTMIAVQALKKIRPALFLGLSLKYSRYAEVGTASAYPEYPELTDAAVGSAGLVLLRDTRKSLLSPSRGHYLYINAAYDKAKYDFGEVLIDLRGYKTWGKRYTLAARVVNDLNFGRPPFYEYAILGGDKFVRGYYYGRYRDNHLSTIQSEFRMPVIWRFGMALFGGLSAVYSVQHPLRPQSLRPNAGAGLRFLIDRKDNTNLRLDYAIGSGGNSGFYIAFGESF